MKSMMTSLTQAFEARLLEGALPGELEGFDEGERAEAAAFVAEAAAVRPPGRPQIRLETYLDEERRSMRLAVVNDDMPFLVDSISSAIAAHDIAIFRIIHPVIAVERDGEGKLISIGAEASAARRESMIYIEMERSDARTRRGLVAEIERTLEQVRSAVEDWRALQAAITADAADLADEGAALLRWFHDGAMTLLAHEKWRSDGSVSDQLGLARYTLETPILAEASRQAAVEHFRKGGEAPLLLKSNSISTVHRRVPLDIVVVPILTGAEVTGLSIHAGLWTSAALFADPQEVPVLRARLAGLEKKFGFDPKGHTGKAMAHALTALPHDLTTAFDAASLESLVLTSMSVADRPRSKLVLVRSLLGRHLFAFVWLPRDEVSTGRREAIGDMLSEAANARLINWSIALEDGVVALLRYTLDLRGGGVMPDAGELDARLERMLRGWVPAVEAALAEQAGSASTRLALRFAGAFPAVYRATSTPEEAARDILRIATLEAPGSRSVRIVPDPEARGQYRIKLYAQGGALALSDAVPVFENFGFRVVEEVPTQLANGIFVHDFEVALTGGSRTLDSEPKLVEDAIAAVLEGRAENDLFNRLIVESGMRPTSVVLFRAWFRYLRQTGLSYGMATVVDALRRAPAVAAALIERFAAAHDPERAGKEGDAVQAATKAIDAGLDQVSAIDDDRILRTLRGVVLATLRTNAFAPAAAEALAFKMDSAKVPGLPAPLPWREIWVYSPRVEGIHLRAGPVARGGLRWSDRRDDFRTEILGLMKAQRVKNAVIVPTGAKGGFYPKQLPSPQQDRDAWFAEGTESYRIFIRSLLSITDNIVGGKVVHPEGVAILDGEDPYFVVAADKGTATFSDVANAIAVERNFWLGDAFASGGSHGYDHKAMGITAKGAWVSVRRHFLEMGVDVQSEPVRVAGCGDMSGDVFGNGMLLSKALKLVAAFDHRHIFLDPDPDPAKSWDERARMFALPRSSWADYNPDLISQGGGVYARTEKSIPLSPEVQAMLGLEVSEIDPTSLISAILKAPVDLLWFGGIGTYVKAASESHVDVGDPANDRLRVNAEQIRARAIGEGANLGVTQAARIAFASLGGRINTDFIDNSAGVDCSDNEVNIKIALNREVIEGRLGFEDRNELLAEMTDDVAHLVLEDNRLQTLALSFMENDGAVSLPSYVRVIEILEAAGRLDRAVEGLAPNEELLRRAQEGRGLTRPELSVLLASTKLALQDAIELGRLGQDPELEDDLLAAFPKAMQGRFATAIEEHRLRNEIVATKLANRIVNRLGVLHPFELAEEEGAAMRDIAAMFVVAERLFCLPETWAAVETAEISEGARLALLDEMALAVRGQIADLLRVCRPGASPSEVIARLQPGIDALDRETKALLLDEVKTQSGRIAAKLETAGAPVELVQKVVRLFEMDGAVGLAELSTRKGIDETVLTRAFTHLGQVLGLDWAQSTAARITTGDPWERLLIAGLARDFQQLRLDFLGRSEDKDPQAAVEAWLEANRPRVDQFANLVRRARQAASPNAAMLAQIAGQARVLLGR
ncbi:NAD-glutamate dehydrogenase [Sphingomonas psychrotolerans]|uniref:NAD-glutamate dehydrogenase n=1 Tax=Sphingomonas psychrotolerans TaxID=1327635 RepID=A0ABU3N7H8_9SPHN|nr:NAD-glutamate dehydrogenase domain-containing protein [Sphingomonas psychrotolerans]MDT8759436.1 NAD-glutamate dehydrogenase [Sphingomonas psychrotolerans]